jgi:hypothetical protein
LRSDLSLFQSVAMSNNSIDMQLPTTILLRIKFKSSELKVVLVTATYSNFSTNTPL